MQKKLIALAVAGLASTAAFAQTNVTIYGIADGSVDAVSISNSTVPANDVDTFGRVSANSSYVGFKGTEDLGNGLKAIFQYEVGVGFDNVGTWSTSRDSFVGLTGGWGTVVMGNLTGPTRALGAALDVNAGATSIGANTALIGKYAGFKGAPGLAANGAYCGKSATCTSIFDTRWANSVAYVSPNWGGFSFVGALVPNENKSNDGQDNTAAQADTWGYDVGVKWEGMGFMAGLTYNAVDAGDVADKSFSNLRLGGSYTGNWGSVRLMWEMTEYEQNLLARSISGDQQKWGIGGTFNLGAKTALIGQFYQALEADNVSNTGAFLATVGVQYSMSKRTMLKAVYSYLDNEDLSAADFGINSAGVTGVGSTVQGLQVGVRHAF